MSCQPCIYGAQSSPPFLGSSYTMFPPHPCGPSSPCPVFQPSPGPTGATRVLVTFCLLTELEFLHLNPELEESGTPGGGNMTQHNLPLLLEAPIPTSGARVEFAAVLIETTVDVSGLVLSV